MTGNLTAVNGTGNNILNLRGNVAKFTTLSLGGAVAVAGDDDDEDEDEDEGGTAWTLASGRTFEFSGQANLQDGLLMLLGNLARPAPSSASTRC